MSSVMDKDIALIKSIIDEVKTQYTMHGGEVEFVDVSDEKVLIRTTGYCHR